MCSIFRPFLCVFGSDASDPSQYKKVDPEMSEKDAKALQDTLRTIKDLDPNNFAYCSELQMEAKKRFNALQKFPINSSNVTEVQDALVTSARKNESIRLCYYNHIGSLQGDSASLRDIKVRLICVIPKT